VISLSGDGGFTMLMGDFLSLVQLGLPVKVVVYPDSLKTREKFLAFGGLMDSALRHDSRRLSQRGRSWPTGRVGARRLGGVTIDATGERVGAVG
jgi:hypothetical protein